MSTRGLVGHTIDGKTYGTYNHFDSYPEGLGKGVIELIGKFNTIEDMKNRIKSLRWSEDGDGFDSYSGAILGKESFLPSYDLGFIADSLFCEWAYIINFDTNKLEIYRGFQKEPKDGQFNIPYKGDGYYPCLKVADIDLGNVEKGFEEWFESFKV